MNPTEEKVDIPKTMRALVLMGADHQELKQVPVPQPGPAAVVNHINTVYKIPDSVGFDVASLITNLGCALYGYETLGGYVAGDDILVIGPGPLGLAAVAAGKALGANRVFLSGTRAARMSIGAKVGADRLISAAEEDPYQVVMQETGGKGVERPTAPSASGWTGR